MFLAIAALSGHAQQQPHTLTYAPGKTITLSIAAAFDINIVATGLRRVRFFAQSPDGRMFVTAMHDLSDNRLGSILILDGWDNQTHTFTRITRFLDHLRNPNSIAFFTDTKSGQSWLYVALTDKLVRYPYHPGDLAPAAPPQTLIRFPDYGLNYKYGGWHLTRTVTVGQAAGAPRIFISVGSSCNYCQEREVARASILSIDPDGANPRIIAQGVRNAVDLRFMREPDGDALFATNMGADHLGDTLPDDVFLRINPAPDHPVNYGWPVCYFAHGRPTHDAIPLPSVNDPALAAHMDLPSDRPDDSVYGAQRGVAQAGVNLAAGGGHAPIADPNGQLGQPPAPLQSCDRVPSPYAWFPAHSSPLGFERFTQGDPILHGSFLVALHGAGHPRIGAGYRVVRISQSDHKAVDFITGFVTTDRGRPTVHGRPCGIFRVAPDSFLLTDDYLGVIYYVHPHG